jgi:hypothetical protein
MEPGGLISACRLSLFGRAGQKTFPVGNFKLPQNEIYYCFVKIWMQDTGCTMQDKNGSDSAYLVPGTWYRAPYPHLKS